MNNAYDLGEQFYLWEIAVAAAGVILEIDAFDQPNVQESKDNTVALLQAVREERKFDEPTANVEGPSSDVTFLSGSSRLRRSNRCRRWPGSSSVAPARLHAITAYIARNETHAALLQELRLKIRDAQ